MNERELDQAKVDTYKRVVNFAKSAVEKEISSLKGKIIQAENELRELRKKGIPMDGLLPMQLKEDLKRYKQLLSKTENDLNYLNDLLLRLENNVTSFIDPEEKNEKVSDLTEIKHDISLSFSETSRNRRIQDLNDEIDATINNYDGLIAAATTEQERKKLRNEQVKRIKKIESRIEEIKKYADVLKKIKENVTTKIKRDEAAKEESLRMDDATLNAFITSSVNAAISNKIGADITEIDNKIASILAKPEKTSEEQLQDTILLVKPLFTKYKNKYGGTVREVDVKNGGTLFDHIMETTNTYAQMGDQIREMENTLAEINATNMSKGKPIYDTHQKLKGEMTYYQELPYRLEAMRKKQSLVETQQKIVMLKRQEVIDKRNHKLSAMEAKSSQLRSSGEDKKADRLDKRIEKLSKKKIRLKSAENILFIEKMKVSWTHKATNEKGQIDSRTWEEEALDNIQSNSRGKTL